MPLPRRFSAIRRLPDPIIDRASSIASVYRELGSTDDCDPAGPSVIGKLAFFAARENSLSWPSAVCMNIGPGRAVLLLVASPQ